MTVIKSNHDGPLGLPRGPVVESGKSVKVDVPGYDRFLRLHAVGSAWLAAGVIEIVSGEEDRASVPAPVAPSAPEADDPHPLDHDADGRPGGSLPVKDRGIDDLRAQYAELFGEAPNGRWGAKRIQSVIDAKLAE